MTLKNYQIDSLEYLDLFFKRCRETSISKAYSQTTNEWSGFQIPYQPISSLPQVPYVCLRIPTGGGKTLIGGLSIEKANRSLLHTRFSVTLWLVPSDPIRTQTLKSLKNPDNLLHKMVFSSLENVVVMDIDEALRIRPNVLNSSNVIIVSTMQAFKRENTDDLNTYKTNSDMLPHFEETKRIYKPTKISFVEMLKRRHPFIIVDEAHNQGTPLAFETLSRFEPSGILELTATPDRTHQPSNVLYSVSAASLQAADMIKMPLELVRHQQPHDAIQDAINCLDKLQKLAYSEPTASQYYIRPIMLIQAEKHSKNHETLEPETVKNMLIKDFKVPEEHIAIATGKIDDLQDNDVLSDNSNIRFIITIDKLREGWDCPFAYILCSFRNTNSKVASEQILGRIMRLPYAQRLQNPELNEAYIFVTSKDFASTVESLREGLIKNGFERQETKDLIHLNESESQEGDLFEKNQEVSFEIKNLPDLEIVSDRLKKKIEVVPETKKVTFIKKPSGNELQEFLSILKSDEDKETAQEAFELFDKPKSKPIKTPSELNELFEIPQLTIKQDDLWEEFDDTHLLQGEWSLVKYPSDLSESEFKSLDKRLDGGKIFLKEEVLKWEYLENVEQQLAFFDYQNEWTQVQLVSWLERNIYEPSILPDEKSAFLNSAITFLLKNRGFSLKDLTYAKFRLRSALEKKFKSAKKQAMNDTYQQIIKFPKNFAVNRENALKFEQGRYAYDYPYTGFRLLLNHFFPTIGNLHSTGEEFSCAEFLSRLHDVKYWVRNVERKPTSFSLQTSTDRFYPDFICKLKDDRILVVEYKNTRDWDLPENAEKRQIGELWESRSNGQGLFVMPKGQDWQAIKNKIKS